MKKIILMALAAVALLLTAAGGAQAQNAPLNGAKEPVRPGNFSLRTNLLHDALLVPSLGFEWRMSDEWGVRVDGAWSYWCTHSAHRIQDVWLVNPEVRRYVGGRKRFYVGLAGSVGGYNLRGLGAIGKLLPDGTGYYGDHWSAGAVVGYQMKLADAFSLDFNIGLGYNRFEYTKFTVVERGLLTYTQTLEENVGRGVFGPTQVGLTLAWHFGKPKKKAAPAPAYVALQPQPQPQPQPEVKPQSQPEVKPQSQPELVMITVGDLLFDFDKAELKPEGMAELARAAVWLRQNVQVGAVVEGHTDNYGGDGYNQRLSEVRARAVYDYFVSEGIAASRLSHRGYGESRPVAGNDTAHGRRLNRRVEIRLIK